MRQGLASIVGSPGRPGGLIGIYPQARIYSWDASPEGLLSTIYVLPGMAAAAKRCPGVVLLSFGLSDREFVHAIENLQEGIDRVVDRGCLVVASTGNQRTQGSPPFYPATLQHVFTVASTSRDGSIAPFSSASPAVDLAAPGVDIPLAMPLAITPSGYGIRSGTSYSAAIVAGAAAWIWTLRPTLQASQVAEILRRSARPLGSPSPNDDFGFGLLDVAAALRTPAPPPDQLEPNDDIVYALPLGTPNHGSWPLHDADTAADRDHGQRDRDQGPGRCLPHLGARTLDAHSVARPGHRAHARPMERRDPDGRRDRLRPPCPPLCFRLTGGRAQIPEPERPREPPLPRGRPGETRTAGGVPTRSACQCTRAAADRLLLPLRRPERRRG